MAGAPAIRWWVAWSAVLAFTAATLVHASPAYADQGVADSVCLSDSTASMSLERPVLPVGDWTTLRVGTNLSFECTSTTLSLVGFAGTMPYGLTLPNTSLSPSQSGTWTLRLTTLTHGSKDIATVTVTMVAPAPAPSPLPAGQTSVTITDGSAASRALFLSGVVTPNATVRIAGNVDMDMSGVENIHVAPGVHIIGDRSVFPQGPRLFTTTFPGSFLMIGSGDDTSNVAADNVRISGIRLDGGAPADPVASENTPDAVAIEIFSSKNVEIDHDEIYGWRGFGVSAWDPQQRLNKDSASSVWVHDNYIHDNQHPTGTNGHGAGYGVVVYDGAYALIEQNVFDLNRHSIAGDGHPGSGYLAYRNLFLHPGIDPGGPSHIVDMHGMDCGYTCGLAGEYMDIAYNTFTVASGPTIKLRGTPSDPAGMSVEDNAFAGTSAAALVQTQTGLHDNGGNLFNTTAFDDRSRSCDFDGDGVSDQFVSTGVTWWYVSSRLGGRYVYLNQSSIPASAVTLGDVNGDGLCDVTAGGVVYNNGGTPNQTGILWNRSDGSSPVWSMSGTAIGGQVTLHGLSGVLGTGDFDGDGNADVLTRDAAGAVSIAHLYQDDFSSDHQPEAAGVATRPDGTPLAFAGIGDLDGDGHADVVWTSTDGHVTIWPGGNAVRSVPVSSNPVDPRWHVVTVQDFDGDGNADILFWNEATGQTTVWHMDGATLRSATPVAVDPSKAVDSVGTWRIAGAGDFNADGKADILWRNADGTLLMWFGGSSAGMATPTAPSAIASDTAWQVIGVGDFNADGNADILWRHSTDGQVAIWTMNGSRSIAESHPGVADSSLTLAGLIPVRGVAPVPLPSPLADRTSVLGAATLVGVSATGGVGPYIWSAAGLPPGMHIDAASGLMTGTPTAGGRYTTSVTVTGGNGQPGTTTFTWTIGVRVPQLVGLDSATATNLLTAVGLVAAVDSESDCIEPGHVLTQDPPVGTLVIQGSAVNVLVDSGTLATCGVIK